MGRKKKVIPSPPPYVPPPKRTAHQAQNSIEENKTLLNAKNLLDIGDVFYRIEKCTITKIIETEGSRDLEVTYRHGQRWNPKKHKAHRRVRPVVHPGNVVRESFEEVAVLDKEKNPVLRENGKPRMKRIRVLTPIKK